MSHGIIQGRTNISISLVIWVIAVVVVVVVAIVAVVVLDGQYAEEPMNYRVILLLQETKT